jgi:hypothetical protein
LAQKLLHERKACRLFHLASDIQLFSAEQLVKFEDGDQSQKPMQNLPQ